jgi:Cyclic-phosphate processing Receiver domain
VKVFLDDIRPAPAGWVRVRTPEEVIELLRSGRVEAVSLDFDLGFRGEEERRTGEVVLGWIEERVFRGEADFDLPVITIHSANPVGRQRLQRALDAIERRLQQPPAGSST